MSREGALRIHAGREFQRVGAATQKALFLKSGGQIGEWMACPCLRTAKSRMGFRGGGGLLSPEGHGHGGVRMKVMLWVMWDLTEGH